MRGDSAAAAAAGVDVVRASDAGVDVDVAVDDDDDDDDDVRSESVTSRLGALQNGLRAYSEGTRGEYQ